MVINKIFSILFIFTVLSVSNNAVARQAENYRQFERSALTLPDSEVETIRNQVLRRCALTQNTAQSQLPWYFHYEFGLELLNQGDPQRALDALIVAANLREDSKRNSRMYGMWFTNYLPYYQIALAHTKLGNWRCAMDALRVSTKNSEFLPRDRGYEEFTDLEKMILFQNPQS